MRKCAWLAVACWGWWVIGASVAACGDDGNKSDGGATDGMEVAEADPDPAVPSATRDAHGCGEGSCGCQDAAPRPAIGGQPA